MHQDAAPRTTQRPLANIAGKSYAQIFREFEGTVDDDSVRGSGDVKYHLGSGNIHCTFGPRLVQVYLAANRHTWGCEPRPQKESLGRNKTLLDRSYEFPILPVLMR